MIIIVKAIAEVERAQGCVESNENTGRIDVAAVELVVVVPGAPALKGGTGIQREVERQVRAWGQATVVHRAHQTDVLPGDGVLAEP